MVYIVDVFYTFLTRLEKYYHNHIVSNAFKQFLTRLASR